MIYSFQDPPGSPLGHAALYDAAIEQVVRAEELGYEWLNLTEHHGTDDGYGPAVLAVLAACAPVTERIGLTTGMLILPLHHPVRIAEETAVVDVLSGGRLTLGVAAGYRELEFELFGVDFHSRGKRFDESLEVLRLSWSGEPFSYAGETIQVPEVAVGPRPIQRPHPKLWIGGTSAPALRRAARHDSPLFPGAIEPLPSLERLRASYAAIRADSGGGGEFDFIVPRLALVADTTEEARRRAHPGITEMFERYVAYGAPPELGESLRDWERLDELVIVGDEARCAAEIERYAGLGVTDLMLQFAMPTLQPSVASESMERFAASLEVASGRRDVVNGRDRARSVREPGLSSWPSRSTKP